MGVPWLHLDRNRRVVFIVWLLPETRMSSWFRNWAIKYRWQTESVHSGFGPAISNSSSACIGSTVTAPPSCAWSVAARSSSLTALVDNQDSFTHWLVSIPAQLVMNIPVPKLQSCFPVLLPRSSVASRQQRGWCGQIVQTGPCCPLLLSHPPQTRIRHIRILCAGLLKMEAQDLGVWLLKFISIKLKQELEY